MKKIHFGKSLGTDGASGRQLGKTLAEGMRHMLDNNIGTDVRIEVGPPGGETVAFRAHKCVLMSRSEVFECMFSSGMTECSGPEARVRVEDIDPDIFKELLNYIYCDRASMCPESAVYLMYAAKKYMLPMLVSECCSCLSNSLDVNNVIHLLEQSLHLDEHRLQSDCLKLISTNVEAVLTGAEILSASRQVLETILDVNTMPVRELTVYETVVSWAKHQLQSAMPGEFPTDLQIREALGDLLYKIRFPVMKPTEFADISSGNDLLTAEEKESIYYFLVNKKNQSRLKFSTKRRIGEEVWVHRTLERATGRWAAAPNLDAITFVTDQDVLLTGIGLYAGYNANGYVVDVEILQSVCSVFKRSATLPYSRKTTMYKFLLDEPIVITAGVIYSVKALSHGRIGYYGKSCRMVCVKDSVTFTFYRHPESQHTTEAEGQIPRLYFRFL